MKDNKVPDQVLQALQSSIERQLELAEEVLAITKTEKESLIKVDTDSLFNLARAKSDKLDLIAVVDREIRAELDDIAPDLGITQSTPLKLLDLLPFLNAEEAALIRKRKDKLAGLREEIINDNIVNKQFTTNVLGYLEDAVALIVNGIQENPVYNRQKREQTDRSRPALLNREI